MCFNCLKCAGNEIAVQQHTSNIVTVSTVAADARRLKVAVVDVCSFPPECSCKMKSSYDFGATDGPLMALDPHEMFSACV